MMFINTVYSCANVTVNREVTNVGCMPAVTFITFLTTSFCSAIEIILFTLVWMEKVTLSKFIFSISTITTCTSCQETTYLIPVHVGVSLYIFKVWLVIHIGWYNSLVVLICNIYSLVCNNWLGGGESWIVTCCLRCDHLLRGAYTGIVVC